MKVLVADTIHEVLYDLLREKGFEPFNASGLSIAEIEKKLNDFEGLVLRSKLTIDKRLIDQNPQLKFVGRVGAGIEHIDVAYCQSKGINVFSSPEGNRQAVAEHALGSLLTLLNKIIIADAQVREGHWIRKQNEGQELQGKTVAIIGYGNTGEAFSKLLSGFATPVIAYDKYKSDYGSDLVKEVGMDEVFEQADVVSIHLPLNSETESMVDAKWISNFKKPIYLINTARGPIVHTSDLIDALEQKNVLGACLDVLEYESENLSMPSFEDLPPLVKQLTERQDVVLTPHIAGLTQQSYYKLSSILAEKIIAHFYHA